ncbi:hypothetical protein TL16_g02040 [Triparma laevis f. inornata]|uniref:Kinesin motor domain-containing protein n=1 Tax=Triparma laevis f. inornata TaxID=1714386 RepID=A0A9W7DVS6_9STRA|nr:hypothetical protein TL16_g02040 [Triparma laevis f. inornata]
MSIPGGIPSLTYVSLTPGSDSLDAEDLIKSDQTLQIHEPGKDKPKTYDNLEGVFDELRVKEEVYSEIFGIGESDEIASRPRALQTFVDSSINCCFLLVGPTSGKKTSYFQGSGDDEHGVIGWLSEQLFNQLNDKEEQAGGQFKYTVTVNFSEHYEEVMTDLLKPDNKDLNIRMDPNYGYQIHGLENPIVRSAEDLKKKLEYGRKSRKTQIFSTGPANDSTGAVFEIVLKQEEGDSPQSMSTRISRMVIVDAPSTTKLVAGPERTRTKEGPLLSKSLFSFVNVCKSLASKKDRMKAPFEQSTFTNILHDNLGAASIVMCLACIAQGEPKVSIQTMKLLGYLKKVNSYPVENDELTQGILVKYRTVISSLIDSYEELKVESQSAPKEDPQALERLKKLEEDLLKANIDGTVAKEDGAKVYRMLELFKSKYTKLEEEKYLLETQKMNAKNKCSDLEIKLADTKEQLDSSLAKENTAVNDKDEAKLALTVMNDENIALKEKVNALNDKGVELGAEVITLLNQKEQFTKMNASLSAKLETAVTKIEDLELTLAKSKKSLSELNEVLDKVKIELEETRGEKLKVELELQSANVSFEKGRVDMEKANQELLRQRDLELFGVRKSAEEELSSMKREKDEITRANAKLEGQIRTLERKIRDMTVDLTRYKDESHSKIADHKRLESQLIDAREQYRSKLLSYLGEEAMAAKLAGEELSKFIDGDKSASNDKKDDKSKSASMTEANSRAALEDLIRTYKEREKDLLALNEKIKRQADENTQKNRLLYSSFFKVKDALWDATDGQVQVEDLPKEDEIKVTESQLQKERDDELLALRQAVAQMRSDSAIQKDRAVELSQSYREMVQQQEVKLKEIASRLSLTQVENDRLVKERDEQKDEKTLKTLETNMEDMQRNILEQIQNVKIEAPKFEPKKRGAPEETAPQGGPGTSESDRRELQALRNKVRKYKSESSDTAKYRQENLSLKEEVQKMKIQMIEVRASSSSTGGGGPSDTTRVASVELQKQLHESELEKHKLSTKVTMLTEELENYKNYMKGTVVKYKREIEGLKKMAAA